MFNGTGKLKLGMTLLGDKHKVRIALHDDLSGQTFFEAEMTPAAFVEMFSNRLSYTDIQGDFYHLERVGKKLEMDSLIFPMPKCSWQEKEEVALKEAIRYCPEGWHVDNYFGSKGSFFNRDNIDYGKATIRRWVDTDENS